MSDQLAKGRVRRKRIVYLIMGSFLIWASYNWYEQSKVVDAKEAELVQLEAQLQKQLQEKEMLEYKIVRLHDPEYLANLARSHLYLSKPGEIIFNFIESPAQESPTK